MAKGRVRSGHVLTCGAAAIANGFMEVLPPRIETLPQRVPPAARRTEDTGLGEHFQRTTQADLTHEREPWKTHERE